MPTSRLCPLLLLLALAVLPTFGQESEEPRPHILFCIADDWGWPHAGAYGEPVVQTPTFDRLAAEGVRFDHAYVSSPSCTPCRSSILTGQHFWRLEEAGNLWSTLPAKFPVYPELLAARGYHVGSWRKAWGPGNNEAGGRTARPAGKQYRGFAAFLDERPENAPFYFWLGSSDPHRPYEPGSGAARGMDLEAVHLPACFPDNEVARGDVADYFFEVERFDLDVGDALAELEKRGMLEDTIVVMTGDHGMPFPRGKGNLYDTGVRVPLALRWGSRVPAGRHVTDFVSLTDLAPTFLQVAGIEPPAEMTGRSLLPLLLTATNGRLDPARDFVLFGRERHTPAQAVPSSVGYPSRGYRTHDFLYVWNCAPDRWPAGVPEGSTRGPDLSDCDGGPTKDWIVAHRGEPEGLPYWDRAFARRPAVELYDLRHDPEQWTNIASDPTYGSIRDELAARLEVELRATADPRVVGGADRFETYPYYGSIENWRAVVRDDLLTLAGATADWALEHNGHYPASLDVLLERPSPDEPPYLDRKVLPRDPWGREYRYEPRAADAREPRVYTLGKDGAPGGTGADADVDQVSLRDER